MGDDRALPVHAAGHRSEAEPRLPDTRIQSVSILGAIGNTPRKSTLNFLGLCLAFLTHAVAEPHTNITP